MRPEEECVCSRKPASERSAITLRMVAGLRPSRLDRASVREPTGSPVEIKVSTIAVRTSRSRLPILGSDGISCYGIYPDLRPAPLPAKYFRCKNLALGRKVRVLLGF